jgi:multiple sugar transport system substrate-binding protein
MNANARTARFCCSLFALMSLVLVACSAGSGSAGGQTLHVLMGINTTYPAQQKRWFQQISSEFQKETGSTVAFDTYNGSDDE